MPNAAADHGAQHEARAEDAAAEAAAEADRGASGLGDRQDQDELQVVLAAEHAIGRLVANPQHLRQPQRRDAKQAACEHRPQPERHAEAIVACLNQRDRTHQGDRGDGADQPQKNEGRDLEKRHHVLRRQDERRVRADMDAGDHGADHGADHHRRERAEPIVADHHLKREDHASDRRVEGARDRRGDAAAEQRLGKRGRQMQQPGHVARQAGAQMHDRALAADRGAAADGGRADERGGNALAQRHAAVLQHGGLHHLGHALGQFSRQNVADEHPDQQATERRRQDDVPPGQLPGDPGEVLTAVAEKQVLDAAGHQAERQCAIATGRPDHHRQEKQKELIVVGEPLPGPGKRGHDGK